MMLCVIFLCDMQKNLTQEALYTSFVLGLVVRQSNLYILEYGFVGKA